MKKFFMLAILLCLTACKEGREASLELAKCKNGGKIAQYEINEQLQLIVCGKVFKKHSENELEVAGFKAYQYDKEGYRVIAESSSVEFKELHLNPDKKSFDIVHMLSVDRLGESISLFKEKVSCDQKLCRLGKKVCDFEPSNEKYIAPIKDKNVKGLLKGEQGHKDLLLAALSGHKQAREVLARAGDLGEGSSLQRSLHANQDYLSILSDICN